MSETEHLLHGKTAIVTGAGGGIGRAIAMALAREGAHVCVNDLSGCDGVDPAQTVADEITAAGGSALAANASVTDADAMEAMIRDVQARFGGLDIVVNNAGILRDGIFHKMTHDDWRKVIDVHLHGSFNVARPAAEIFRTQGSGHFVHMTSTSGLIGNVGQANYAAAKMGLVGLSRSIALDMARFGVTSNVIAPFAGSQMIASVPVRDESKKRVIEQFKLMEPGQIAPLAVALCSDDAGEISGQVFAVRRNEIFLMSQSRPVRSAHRGEGWTPQGVLDTALPALGPSLVPLERSADVFSWDPI